MKLDLHIHSKYSVDSISKPEKIILAAKKRKLNGVAITDHNTIKGAIETQKINTDKNFIIIVGAEIATEAGDIIGLFLKKEIKSKNSLDVINEIHRQKGVAVLPHPFRGHKLNEEIIKKIDVIEGFNSRDNKENNQKAMELAKKYKKPIIAGSDAHFCSDIGLAKTTFNSLNIRDGILKKNIKLETRKTQEYKIPMSQIIKSIKSKKYTKLPIQFASMIVKIIKRK